MTSVSKDVSERILNLMQANNISYANLAEKTGCSKSALQRYFTGNTQKVPIDVIEKVAPALNVTAAYLMGWEEQDPAFNNSILESSPDIFPIRTKKVPIIGGIACGEPIFHEEDFASYVETDIETKADFAMRCHGDSMINIGVKDGDIALIRSQPLVNNGEIAAVNIDGEFTLKRFYDYGNIIVLRAENPKFPDLEYKKGDADNIVILGKAIAYQSWIY